jgi:uncharacterized repeat protein (TIGR01451 family)
MKRSALLGVIGLCFWVGVALWAPAFQRPSHQRLPNYDKRVLTAPQKPVPAATHALAVARLHSRLPGAVVETDPILGWPCFVKAQHEFLTGPNGEGKAVSAETARAFAMSDPHRVTKAFLRDHPNLFGHGPEVLQTARIKRDYTTPHNGLRTTVWEQELDGIPVYGAVLISHVTRKGELVNLFSRCLPNLAGAAEAGVPNRQAILAAPPISAPQAIALAAQNLGAALDPQQVQPRDPAPTGPTRRQRFTARPVLNGDVYVWLSWLPMDRETLRLCWQVHLVVRDRGEGFLVLVDAETGEVLLRQNRTAYISDATYRIFDRESPSPFLPGHPTPQTGQPPVVERVLLVTPALDTTASPNGWIDDGVNETIGNNVDAHTDWDDDDQPDLPRPQGNPQRVFDFPLDLNQEPTNYAAASVVQLFYYNNFMHDRLYQLGFTEAAGNFQTTNFGRGGLEGDAVLADAQDGGGVNNANMYTPPDGVPGRMQMYLFDGPTPDRDGSLDGLIVLHEYTHGLSWRLVAGGDALGTLQSDGMGEGWSDFYSLALLTPTNADPNGCYPHGAYACYLLDGLTENYYFGIRRYPYSTDMSKNPLTFKDIDPDQADPHLGVPLSPLYSPFDPTMADEVHYQGEVWCMALWEMRANLIAKYGPVVGNEMALQLVTDGMRLSPATPNFLQARDAIVQADLVNNGYANFDEIWRAFAKRGMGGSAWSPPSSTTRGVVEAFDMPGLSLAQAWAEDRITGNANGVVDFNECNELYVALINKGRSNATHVSATLTALTPGVIVSQASSTYSDILPMGTATNLEAFRFYTLPNFICGTPIKFSLTVVSDLDTRTIAIELETGQIGNPIRFDNNTPVDIPDANPVGGDSPVVVSGFASAVSKVVVSLHIVHTLPFDLTLELIGPDGTRTTLAANPFTGLFGQNYGIGCTPEGARTTFDDKGTVTVSMAFPPWVGTFQPLEPLAKFKGKSGPAVNGTWRLRVTDLWRGYVGTIQCWSLHLYPTLCTDGGGDCSTDLGLTGTLSPNPPFVGTNITYTFLVTNHGPNAGRDVLLTDTLPARTTFVSATADRGQCTPAAGAVNCRLGNLPSGASARVTIVVRPDESTVGMITNIATVSSAVSDSNLTNNTVVLISRVLPPTPIIVPAGATLLAESVNPPNGGLDVGETVTLGLALQNIGSKDTSNLVARLLAGGGVTPQTTLRTYGRLPPGGPPVSRDFTFTASGTNGGSVTVTLQLTDGTNTLPDVQFTFGLSTLIAFTNHSRISVPDQGPATNVYPSQITVRDVPGLLRKVAVTLLNVEHTSPADLDVLLVGPKGDTVLIMSDAGGGYSISGTTLTFEDGGTPLPESSRINSGTYGPTDYPPADLLPAPAPAGPYGTALSVFNGSSPNGVWSLYVADDAGGDSGRIGGGWALTLFTVDPVDPTADLKVVGTGAPETVRIGSNVTYTLLVTNLGPDPVNNVVLTNSLSPGVAFVSAQTSLGSCTNVAGQVRCVLGALSNQANATITITAQALRSGTWTNVVTVSSEAKDPNPVNSRAVTLTSVSPEADLAVAVAGPASLPINEELSWTVTVTNQGPDRAMGVWLTNWLPAGLTNVLVSSSQGSCSLSSNRLTCNLLVLTNTGRATVTVRARALNLGALTNRVEVAASSPDDLWPANNSAEAVTTVTDPYIILVPDNALLLSENFVPPSGGLDPGETVRVALALRNVGVSNTTALVARLLDTGGVTAPSDPQSYGVVVAGGLPVAREFSFTAQGTNGGLVTATLELQDGTNRLGTVQFHFVLGGGARFVSSAAVSIPDNTRAIPYPSTIVVSNLSGVVGWLTVTLDGLTHPYPADLDVLLVGPNGQAVLLMSDAGAGNGITNVTLTFDDRAVESLPKFERISSGLWRPTDYPPLDSFPAPAPPGPYSTSLATFNYIDPNGPWSLYILDDAFGDIGMLSGGWALEIITVGLLNLPLQPPRLTQPMVQADGTLRFTVQGDAGVTYAIEASEDLATWTEIGTVSMTERTAVFVDPQAGSLSRRFYRARLSP